VALRRTIVVTNVARFPSVMDAITDDIARRIDAARIESVNQMTHNVSRHARWLAPRRMPSRGAGGYGQMHGTRIHHDPPGSLGASVGEAYNNHEWAMGVEKGTSPHVEYATKGTMKIRDVIPGYYKGRNINTVPYGVKYERKKPPLQVWKVDHPGSRAFWVYRDSALRMIGMLPQILRRAFKDAWK